MGPAGCRLTISLTGVDCNAMPSACFDITVDSAIEALMDHAEALTRAEIETIPDGNYEFTDWLDGDGGSPPSEPLPFTVTVGVSGSDIHFDFTGTAPQVPTSFNNVPASTMSASLRSASATLVCCFFNASSASIAFRTEDRHSSSNFVARAACSCCSRRVYCNCY